MGYSTTEFAIGLNLFSEGLRSELCKKVDIAFPRFICEAVKCVTLNRMLSERLETNLIGTPWVIKTKTLSEFLSSIVEPQVSYSIEDLQHT